jgi:hypothetical protein
MYIEKNKHLKPDRDIKKTKPRILQFTINEFEVLKMFFKAFEMKSKAENIF